MPTYSFGNGSATPIKGRGVLHCHPDRRLDLAVAAALGRPVVLSNEQIARDFHVPRAKLKELVNLHRAWVNGNEVPVADPTVPKNGNGAAQLPIMETAAWSRRR